MFVFWKNYYFTFKNKIKESVIAGTDSFAETDWGLFINYVRVLRGGGGVKNLDMNLPRGRRGS